MQIAIPVFTIIALAGCFLAGESRVARSVTIEATANKQAAAPQPNTLCAKDERVIFSCPVKRPAKIVSVCASKDLTGDRGYLQYRFGLPGKIELEYPKDRNGTQQKFKYSHYFRAQFDMTSINFTIDGTSIRCSTITTAKKNHR